jgi:hypothetical protein
LRYKPFIKTKNIKTIKGIKEGFDSQKDFLKEKYEVKRIAIFSSYEVMMRAKIAISTFSLFGRRVDLLFLAC